MPGTLWLPRSACGPECLPEAARRPTGALRLLRLFAVVLGAALVIPVLPLRSPLSRKRFVQGRCRAALRALGITVSVRGHLPPGRALVVANHVSWLDILVLLGHGDLRLVAKSEVGDWPVIGPLAARAGAIFIDRSRPLALPATVAEVRRALAAGDVVAAFPEGTTSCGRTTGPFRPALFQAAVDATAAVVPVRLRYELPGGSATAAAAFVGDETLIQSLRRILRVPGLSIRLTVESAIHPLPGLSRRLLARLANSAAQAEWPAATPTAPPATTPPLQPPQRTSAVSRTAPGALPRAA